MEPDARARPRSDTKDLFAYHQYTTDPEQFHSLRYLSWRN